VCPSAIDADHDPEEILISNRRIADAPPSIRAREDKGTSILQPSCDHSMSKHHVVAAKDRDLTNLDLGGGAWTYSQQISRVQRRVHARPAHGRPGLASNQRRLFRVDLGDCDARPAGLAGSRRLLHGKMILALMHPWRADGSSTTYPNFSSRRQPGKDLRPIRSATCDRNRRRQQRFRTHSPTWSTG
jgi:hypothetical protein